jgi:hypothetical protein
VHDELVPFGLLLWPGAPGATPHQFLEWPRLRFAPAIRRLESLLADGFLHIASARRYRKSSAGGVARDAEDLNR